MAKIKILWNKEKCRLLWNKITSHHNPQTLHTTQHHNPCKIIPFPNLTNQLLNDSIESNYQSVEQKTKDCQHYNLYQIGEVSPNY